MNDRTAEQVVSVLKALSHPVRLKIAEMLGSGEKCVSEIIKEMSGKQLITSRQLNMIKGKGVLNCRREGARVCNRSQFCGDEFWICRSSIGGV